MLARSMAQTDKPLPMMRCEHHENAQTIDISDTRNKYYISIDATDIPGIIGIIGKICGDNNINISSILQEENDTNSKMAEIAVITGVCKEADIQKAVNELNNNQCKVINIIRVME